MHAKILWLVGVLALLGCADIQVASQKNDAEMGRDAESLNDHSPQPGHLTAASQNNLAEKPALGRKIIYHATIAAETTEAEMERFATDLENKLAGLGGFIANQSEHRSAGKRGTTTWTIRIDASQFSDLLSWIDNASRVTRKEINSKDVSEEFVDLTARVENKRHTEKRLVATLAERTGKLEDVLAIEREIDRVREEIERIEGRFRYLSEQVALSTITLTLSTRTEFSATKEVAYSTELGETWNRSLMSLVRTGQNIGLAFVAMAPWLPILLLFAGAFYWGWKRLVGPQPLT